MNSERGHEARFQDWWREHRGIFHRVARAYASTPEDQADLFQEMAVQLWRSLPGFKEQCRPSTWIYRVCLNTALGWQRGRRTRLALLTAEFDRVEHAVSEEPRPGWTQEKADLLERLYAGIRTLTPDERTVILLSLEGQSYREIGEITGLTENHVGVALTRARQALAEKLQEVRDEL